jgi:hypothetical protein
MKRSVVDVWGVADMSHGDIGGGDVGGEGGGDGGGPVGHNAETDNESDWSVHDFEPKKAPSKKQKTSTRDLLDNFGQYIVTDVNGWAKSAVKAWNQDKPESVGPFVNPKEGRTFKMPRGLVIVRNPDHLEGELTHVLNAVMIRYKLHRLAMSFAFTRFKPGGRPSFSQYVLLASAQPDLLAFARALDPKGLSRDRLTAIDRTSCC